MCQANFMNLSMYFFSYAAGRKIIGKHMFVFISARARCINIQKKECLCKALFSHWFVLSDTVSKDFFFD